MSKPKLFFWLTFAAILSAVGTHFFRFPDNFNFGGVTGLSIVLKRIIHMSPATINFIANGILLIVGFLFLGRKFLVMTAYVALLSSFLLSLLQRFFPLSAPLTDEPLLNMLFAIAIPAIASAMLFNISASGGGTDITAAILHKYLHVNFGTALLVSDVLIVTSSFFFFSLKTCLFSVVGLIIKSFVIDNVIESFNLCKYFNVICEDPTDICDFITKTLNHSATVSKARGAFSHRNKYIIFTVLTRSKAVRLRNYIRETDPNAFIMITNSSEIIGKGFLTR